MGFLEQLFGKLSERDELLLQAGRVGDQIEVIKLGIHAAKLGLTEDDLAKMARLWLLVHGDERD